MIAGRRTRAEGQRTGTPRLRAVVWAALATLFAAVFSFVDPAQLPVAAVIWAILLGVIALAYAAAVMLRAVPLQTIPRRELELPARLRLRRRHRQEREAIPGLTEMERMVIFGRASAYDFESRLRPHLVAIADQRLNAHGLTLHSSPQRVRALLGPEAWELVRPDYQPVGDRQHHGVPEAKLERVVESLDVL